MEQIESLALFPLSDVVLLPEVSVPLYIFEPRYREMTHDVLSGNQQIGMVTVRPDAVQDMAGDPRIFEIGCVGRIAQAQQRPDGTYQIMLVGESRFRILEEAPRQAPRLYRTARVELLEEKTIEGSEETARLHASREELLELLERLVRRVSREEDPSQTMEAFKRLESPRLVNALTQAISFSPVERQQLLEVDSATRRFETMSDLLRFRLAEMGMNENDGPSLPN